MAFSDFLKLSQNKTPIEQPTQNQGGLSFSRALQQMQQFKIQQESIQKPMGNTFFEDSQARTGYQAPSTFRQATAQLTPAPVSTPSITNAPKFTDAQLAEQEKQQKSDQSVFNADLAELESRANSGDARAAAILAAQRAGNTLSVPATLARYGIASALGKNPEFDVQTNENNPSEQLINYSARNFLRDTTGKDVIGAAQNINPLLGTAANVAAETLLDPLSYVGTGLIGGASRGAKSVRAVDTALDAANTVRQASRAVPYLNDLAYEAAGGAAGILNAGARATAGAPTNSTGDLVRARGRFYENASDIPVVEPGISPELAGARSVIPNRALPPISAPFSRADFISSPSGYVTTPEELARIESTPRLPAISRPATQEGTGYINPINAVWESPTLPINGEYRVQFPAGQNRFNLNGVSNEIQSEPLISSLSNAEQTLGESTPVSRIASKASAESPPLIPPSDAVSDAASYVVDPVVRETTTKLQRLFRDFHSNIVSGQSTLERASKLQNQANTTLEDSMQLVRNAANQVENIQNSALADRNGNIIGKSFNETASITPKFKGDYQEYRARLHNIDRQKVGKPVLDETAQESATEAARILKSHPEFKQYDDAINNWWDTFMKEWVVNSGSLSPEQYRYMKDMYPNYIPTSRKEWDELFQGGIGTSKQGNRITVGKTIKGAKGSTAELVDFDDGMRRLINTYVRALRKNELNRNLIEWAASHPEEAAPFAHVNPADPADDIFKNGINGIPLDAFVDAVDRNSIKELKKGPYQITAYVNGKPMSAAISRDVYNSLDNLYRIDFGRAASIADIGRGISNPFRAVVTGYNPIFMAKNILRDVPNAYINSIELNPIKYAQGMFRALREMATMSDAWKAYKALGGKGANYYTVNKGFNAGKLSIVPRKIKSGLNTLGETTESLPRFTEYLLYLDKYGDNPVTRKKAIRASAEVTTNFARTAPITKFVDSWMPYTNAQVQGLDKFIRQVAGRGTGGSAAAVKKSGATIAKGAGITAVSIALYEWNKNNPHFKELDNRTKDTNFLLPNLGDVDSDGYAKTFIKIPKTRDYGPVFGAFMERMARWMEGEREPFKDFAGTLSTNFSPQNPVTDNFLAPAFINIPLNKDFAGRTIVPQSMQNRSPELQYDEKTSEVAKTLGKTVGKRFGLSPKQIDYLIRSYTGVIGQVGVPLSTAANWQGTAFQNATQPITSQFVADPIYSNQTSTDFYDALDNFSRQKANKDFLGERGLTYSHINQKYVILNKASNEISKLNKELQSNYGNAEKSREIRMEIIARQIKALSDVEKLGGK